MIDFLDNVLDRIEPYNNIMMAFVYGLAVGVIIMDIAYNG
jgi:hypothetical protein